MRKIEEEMLAAITGKKTWTKSNTYVFYNKTFDFSEVYLYGNHIARVGNKTTTVSIETLLEHPTPTTTSRLRALGVNVVVKKGLPYIDGKLVT